MYHKHILYFVNNILKKCVFLHTSMIINVKKTCIITIVLYPCGMRILNVEFMSLITIVKVGQWTQLDHDLFQYNPQYIRLI